MTTRARSLLGLLASLAACAGAPTPAPDGGAGGLDASAPGDAGSPDAGAGDAGLAELLAAVDLELGPRVSATALTDPSRCPSAVAVVVTAGATLVRGYGLAGPSAGAPTGDTLYQVGSVTKVYTGLALARLVVEGALPASGPARDHVASDLGAAVPASVTFAGLAAHTSGLPNMPANLPRLADGGVDPLSPAGGYSRAQLVTFLSSVTPGPQAYLYSNLGSGLLGLALTDATDAGTYDALLRAQVLSPLGMADTWGQVGAVPQADLARVAQGYAWAPVLGSWRPGRLANMGVLAGGGELVTSGNDVSRLLRALAGLDETPLAAAVTLAEAPLASISPGKDIGYALVIARTDGGVSWRKDGATPSYTSLIAVQRSPALGVAVLSACSDRFGANELGLALFERLRPLVAR